VITALTDRHKVVSHLAMREGGVVLSPDSAYYFMAGLQSVHDAVVHCCCTVSHTCGRYVSVRRDDLRDVLKSTVVTTNALHQALGLSLQDMALVSYLIGNQYSMSEAVVVSCLLACTPYTALIIVHRQACAVVLHRRMLLLVPSSL
jgi:hypothetical protein